MDRPPIAPGERGTDREVASQARMDHRQRHESRPLARVQESAAVPAKRHALDAARANAAVAETVGCRGCAGRYLPSWSGRLAHNFERG
jgi:hypothetical protein